MEICMNCYHGEVCSADKRIMARIKSSCDFFEDKSYIFKMPFVAMIEQHLIKGKFLNNNTQNKNGIYAVVYMDKNKWGSPLIDICGKTPHNREEAEIRLEEIKNEKY